MYLTITEQGWTKQGRKYCLKNCLRAILYLVFWKYDTPVLLLANKCGKSNAEQGMLPNKIETKC